VFGAGCFITVANDFPVTWVEADLLFVRDDYMPTKFGEHEVHEYVRLTFSHHTGSGP
jgi:hypothetical protein